MSGVLLVHPSEQHSARAKHLAERSTLRASNTLKADYMQPKLKLAIAVVSAGTTGQSAHAKLSRLCTAFGERGAARPRECRPLHHYTLYAVA